MASTWGACEVFLYNWQTLVTGGVALLVGGATVVAIRKQIEDQKRARDETDRRRRIVIEWAVRAEAERLDQERLRVDDLWKKKIYERIPGELNIDSSPLLRGEREDVALLPDKVEILGKIYGALSQYNGRTEMAVKTAAMGLDQQAKELREACDNFLQQLYALTVELKK